MYKTWIFWLVMIRKIYRKRKAGWREAAFSATIGSVCMMSIILILLLNEIFRLNLREYYQSENDEFSIMV